MVLLTSQQELNRNSDLTVPMDGFPPPLLFRVARGLGERTRNLRPYALPSTCAHEHYFKAGVGSIKITRFDWRKSKYILLQI